MTPTTTAELAGDALTEAVAREKGWLPLAEFTTEMPDTFSWWTTENESEPESKQVLWVPQNGALHYGPLPGYATSIAAAESLLDELPPGYTYALQSWRSGRVEATIFSPSWLCWQAKGDPKTDAKPLTAAICRAFLAYKAHLTT